MSDPIELQVAGRVGPHRESHEPRLQGLDFLADGVTPVQGFFKFDLTHGQTQLGMACNGDLGCCGFSADQHLNALKALAAGDANWMQISLLTFCPQFKSLEPAYFAYGIAQGEPGPRPDEGVDNATMLAWLYKLGLIDGYMEVPKGYEDWFAMTFNGALVGQGLDGPTAIADFNANPRRPWNTMPMPDGHDTVLAIGDGEGGGSEITWGGVQPFTPGYRQTNWQDCWVIIDKDDTIVNFVALKAILTEMHGVVESAPESPTPEASESPANASGGTETPGDVIDDSEQGFVRACEEAVKDLRRLITDETAKAPEDEKEIKRLVAKTLSEAIPSILAKIMERLAIAAVL